MTGPITGRPDPRLATSWCREGAAHDHDACGLLWDSAARSDAEAAARWADDRAEEQRASREEVLDAAERIGRAGVGDVTDTDVRLLAQSLLDIAKVAMPDTYFAEDSRCQLARAVKAATLRWAEAAYWDDTCGDCIEGRCHWGGETSLRSTEMAGAGEDYEDPTFGRCGCARHTTSVAARAYQRDTFEATVLAWQAGKDAGSVVTVNDDNGRIWVSGPVTGDLT